MIERLSEEYNRLNRALAALPQTQWDAICRDCFPSQETVTIADVIAKINQCNLSWVLMYNTLVHFIPPCHYVTVDV